jgi:uracil-DNA glycosylase
MIVGEAPGAEEAQRGEPFMGASGMELNRMLSEAGISRSECFLTNVARDRPRGGDMGDFIAFKKKDRTAAHIPLRDMWVKPQFRADYDQLKKEIELVRPNLIIALGATALWALTGKWGIVDWRGSELFTDQIRFPDGSQPTVIPTYNPAAILRQWDWRPVCVHDLKKAKRMSGTRERIKHNIRAIIRPNYDSAAWQIKELFLQAETQLEPLWLSIDIETRAGHIACIGFAWSKNDAICIPLMQSGKAEGYWLPEEETQLVWLMRRLMMHPNVKIIGQNFSYDAQYIARHWLFLPIVAFDTLIGAHSCFSNLPKSLGFLSSLYCEHHVYWKDDGKTWDASTGEEQLWTYNCEDCCRTHEIAFALMNVQHQMGLRNVNDFQQSLFGPVMRTIQRGVRIDQKKRSALAMELQDAMHEREQWLKEVLGQELNVRSPKQMMDVFGEQLKLPTVKKRRASGEYTPSFDDDSLTKMAAKEPIIRPIVQVIADIRSLGVFFANFISAPLDFDARMRCAYNIGGTKTYRFSCNESAFGVGTNLQTISSGDKD